jgi:transcriptional regulator NrdR family protein
MDYGKYDRQVELLCPTCGGKEFDRTDHRPGGDGAEVVCASCGRRMTSAELQELNGESIDLAVNEMAKEVLDDVAEELRKSLRRATRGSRNIRVR